MRFAASNHARPGSIACFLAESSSCVRVHTAELEMKY